MATFTINSESNITAHAGLPPAGANEPFANLKDLAKLTAKWPASRLVDIWNSFAGVAPFNDVKPVKKFTNRNDALARIWKAVERLAPIVAQPVTAQPAGDVAPVEAKAKKNPPKTKRRDTARPGAKAAKRGAPPAREGSKKAEVVDLIRRPSGAMSQRIGEISRVEMPSGNS